ncbi:MAG: response regulator [Candidatus Zixiibacteriota bacterium]
MSEKKKILIIEDEADQRDLLIAYFEDNDYDTITAEDGQKGFELAKTENVSLITLDISMDNESGIKAIRNLQETPATANIPVIMITGVSSDFKRFLERSKKVNPPQGYFDKPVDRDALLKKVKELIG